MGHVTRTDALFLLVPILFWIKGEKYKLGQSCVSGQFESPSGMSCFLCAADLRSHNRSMKSVFPHFLACTPVIMSK